MRLEMRCAINFQTYETWNEMCYLKLFKPIMEGCLFETFRSDLKWDVLLESVETFETFQTYQYSTGGLSYFRNFHVPWDLKWDVLFETFETFQTYHGGLLIWNFQMRLEMRCAIRNFWNLSNLFWSVAYWKLSDEAWNEMCYLKLVKPIMEGCLFETFRWDLKWDVLLETFQTYHGGLLIWNFQMRLEMRCAIRNFLKLVKSIMECCLFETFRWDLKWDVLLETFETFQTYHGGLLIGNFQMRLEMRYAIRNLLKPIRRVAYLKLSDETWNEMCY